MSKLHHRRFIGIEIGDKKAHLNTYGQIVLLNRLIIQRMIDFDVGPCIAIVLPLLQIECVVLVCLRRRSRHQTIKHGRIAFDTGAILVRLVFWGIKEID